MDLYFSSCTFCGDEDFYLIALPSLFWCYMGSLGRHLTLIVTLGLVMGNYLKDVCQLPRPKGVWVPTWLIKNDSSGLRDYGFPSTHAMNGVSNAIYVFLYFFAPAEGLGGGRPPPSAVPVTGAIILVLWWIFNLTVGRMYLGVHTTTDIRGGIVIGVLWVFFYHYRSAVLDNWVFTAYFPAVQLSLAVILLISTTPWPEDKPTISFFQSCTASGLAVGCMQGTRMVSEGALNLIPRLDIHLPYFMTEFGVISFFSRLVLGTVVLLVGRTAIKMVFTLIAKILHVNIKEPGANLLAIFVASVYKFSCNIIIAIGVVYGAPALFIALGMMDREVYNRQFLV